MMQINSAYQRGERRPKGMALLFMFKFFLSSHKVQILFYTSIIINSLITTEPEILLNPNLVCIIQLTCTYQRKAWKPYNSNFLNFNIKTHHASFFCTVKTVQSFNYHFLLLGGRLEIILCWANVKRIQDYKGCNLNFIRIMCFISAL